MREIKFRAWSNDIKKMYPYALVGFNGELWVHKNDSHNGEWKNIGCGNDEEIVDYSYEILQFTGLLDKNGKEIYEGDIVGNQRSGIILFEEGEFNGHYYGSAGDIQEAWEEPLRYNNEDCEIVGNIYENPELLTK